MKNEKMINEKAVLHINKAFSIINHWIQQTHHIYEQKTTQTKTKQCNQQKHH